ncbi:MAG: hypothetical protein ABL958_12215, partial [Bdellovibrionia bacterium]
MLKVFWAAVAISFAAFVFVTIQVGVGPRPIQVIRPSAAKEPAEIGFWFYRQLRHVVFKHRVFFVGYQNEKVAAEVAKGFWESAKNDGQEIGAVIKLRGAAIDLPVQTFELLAVEDLPKLLPQVASVAKKFIVFLPSQDTSHVVKNSLVQKTEVLLNENIMSFSELEWRPDHPADKMVFDHCEDAKRLTGFP